MHLEFFTGNCILHTFLTYVCTHRHTYAHTDIRMHICTYIQTHMQIRMHIYTTHTFTYVYTSSPSAKSGWFLITNELQVLRWLQVAGIHVFPHQLKNLCLCRHKRVAVSRGCILLGLLPDRSTEVDSTCCTCAEELLVNQTGRLIDRPQGDSLEVSAGLPEPAWCVCVCVCEGLYMIAWSVRRAVHVTSLNLRNGISGCDVTSTGVKGLMWLVAHVVWCDNNWRERSDVTSGTCSVMWQ